jgi:hypothetical protein
MKNNKAVRDLFALWLKRTLEIEGKEGKDIESILRKTDEFLTRKEHYKMLFACFVLSLITFIGALSVLVVFRDNEDVLRWPYLGTGALTIITSLLLAFNRPVSQDAYYWNYFCRHFREYCEVVNTRHDSSISVMRMEPEGHAGVIMGYHSSLNENKLLEHFEYDSLRKLIRWIKLLENTGRADSHEHTIARGMHLTTILCFGDRLGLQFKPVKVYFSWF